MPDRNAAHRSARWILRALMQAYPAAFRHRFGNDLIDAQIDRRRDANVGRSWLRSARYWARCGAVILRDGTLERVREWRRARTSLREMSTNATLQDIRYGIRSLARRPAFSLAVICTLALGIGANSAMYSIVDGVLLRPLPFADPDRIVRVWSAESESDARFLDATFAEFLAFRDQNHSLSEIAGFSIAPRHLEDEYGNPSKVTVARMAGDLFRVLGVLPAYGRQILPEEDRGSERVVVLSHGIWQRRYGGDAGILGRTISIRQVPYAVVGVMPPDYEYPKGAEMWRPFAADEYHDDDRELKVVARLGVGVTIDQASADIRRIAAQLEATENDSKGMTPWLQPMHGMLVRDARTPLLLLLSAVGMVLTVACVNVASLILANGTAREREIATRMAIGAGRGRIVRQLLTENLLLASLGGLTGIALGRWALDAMIAMSPPETPRLTEVALDLRVIVVMMAITVIAGVAFGLYPAVQAAKPTFLHALRSGHDIGATGTKRRALKLLVTAEVALSTVLTIAAGLLIVSFTQQLRFDRGFDTDRTLSVPIDPPRNFETGADVRTYFGEILARIRQLPDVESAVLSTTSPMDVLGFRLRVGILGGDDLTTAPSLIKIVSAGFFDALGIRVLAGRAFSNADGLTGEPVVVANETFVKAFIGTDAGSGVDRSIVGPLDQRRIVGVIAPLTPEPHTVPRPTLYIPFEQLTIAGGTLLIRTSGDPASLIPTIRTLIWEHDPDVPLNQIATIEDEIAETIASPRFSMLLTGLFAALALTLAAVGIYGVTSYTVGQRRQEMALRHALGARPDEILRLVVGGSVKIAGQGIIVGLLGSVWLTRFIGSLLYGVSPLDPTTLGGVAVLMVGVAAVAAYVPARRAVTVDPIDALRVE